MNKDATTILEWTFEPTDFFEEIFDIEVLSASVHIAHGVASGYFPASEYEQGRKFRDEAHQQLEPHFFAQAITTGKQFVLNPARLSREYTDGRSDQTMFVETAHIKLSTTSANIDFIVRDKDGTVTSDTRAERIKEQTEFRKKLVNALPNHPEIRMMAASWSKSFEDEANCFVHLFEVLDRLKKIFVSARNAKKALDAKDDWDTIGDLSNRGDNALGRHRGMGTNHKEPDQDTLRKSREAARRLIIAYVDNVSRS